jgi:hypothetical protein
MKERQANLAVNKRLRRYIYMAVYEQQAPISTTD